MRIAAIMAKDVVSVRNMMWLARNIDHSIAMTDPYLYRQISSYAMDVILRGM